jgi:hypothetical protein
VSEPAPAIAAVKPEVAPDAAKHAPATVAGGTATSTVVAPDRSSITYPKPPNYFLEALEDAERLLKYAAETGVDIDLTTRSSVLTAHAAGTTGWTRQIADDLLAALTVLATKLKPVTAESLRSFNTKPTVRTYWIVAICLAAIIVPFSVASFIASGLATLINKDVTAANELAVKLTTQLGPYTKQQATSNPAVATNTSANTAATPIPAGLNPTEVITELQTFASLIRSIHARTRQLDSFILNKVSDPFTGVIQQKGGYKSTFQLPVPLPPDLYPVVSGRVVVYQDARAFAQDVMDRVSIFYGAMSSCILPVLYALLGTCAYLLRSFSQEMSSRTFVPSHSDSARFLIAAIAGCVVGLFKNVAIGDEASIPPLAIAFIVGYAVDVFFSFLEALIQAFTRSRTRASTVPAEKG